MSVQAARLIARYESQGQIGAGGRQALLKVQAHPDTTGSQQTEIARILRDARAASQARPRGASSAGEVKGRFLKRFAEEQADSDRRRLRADIDAALEGRGVRGANLIAARDLLTEQLDAGASVAAVRSAVGALSGRSPQLFESAHRVDDGRLR